MIYAMQLLIENIKKYIRLNPEEESVIKNWFVELNLNPGDYLLREGNVCRHVSFIEQGLLRYFFTDDGNEKTIYFNREDEFVCNYQSFLPKTSSDISIQAVEKTKLYVISYENLQKFYSTIKEGERFGRLAIEFDSGRSLQPSAQDVDGLQRHSCGWPPPRP